MIKEAKRKKMKREYKVLLLSVFFGLLVWVLNALSDYFFFYQQPFLDLLILNVPPVELYIRLIVIVIFLAFGTIVAWRLARRRKFERKLIQRERYLSCLADISAELLAASDPVEAMPGVLRRMLEVSGADRCYLFENHRGPSGEMLTSQRFEVCAEGVEPQMDNPDLQNVPWIKGSFSRWIDEMTAGRAIYGAVADFPESERAVLEAQDIHWILALPLHVRGEWHGFIGLDACRSGLKWTGQEIDLLSTAANSISSAIGRSKTEERFQRIFDNAKDGIFIETTDGRIVDVNKAACRMLGYTREELCSMHVKDLVPPEIAAQLPETIQDETVRDGKYIETVNVRKDGTRLPVEVSDTLVEIWGEKMVIAILRDITERKRAEERLAYLSLATEWIGEMVIVTDLNHKISYANDAVKNILGYKPEEMIGHDAAAFFEGISGNPANLVQWIAEQKKPEVWRGELFNRKKDGSMIRVHMTLNWLRDKDGRVIGCVGNAMDITERKKAEEELRESEEKYRALIETTDTGYLILDGAGRVIDANPEYVRLTGHKTLDEIVGRTVIEWTAAHDKERNAEEVKKCMEKGVVRNLEIDYVDKDGNITPIEVNAKVVETAEGVRILSLCRDITKRKRAEEALWESEKKYKSIVENSRDVIMLTSQDGKISYISPACKKVLGYDPEDLIGRQPWIVHPDDLDMVKGTHDRSLQGESGLNLEYRVKTKAGETRWISHSWSPVFTKDEFRMIVSVIRDINERKQAEEELKGRTERIARQQAAILELSKEDFSDLDFALRRIMKVDARTLVVERVNIWLFNEDRSELVCLRNYRRSKDRYEEGGRLSLKQYPAYFKALESSRIVAVNDARSDPRTCEFTASYLSTHGITSMIDVPIRLHGEIIGLICHEHVGPIREWAQDEQDFTGSMADMVSLAFEASERKQAEERFRLAAGVASDLIYEWDIESDRLEWYGDIDEALGYEPGKVPRTIEAWASLIHPDDRKMMRDSVELHRVSTEPIYEEYRIRRKDGAWLHWTDSGVPVLDEAGRPRRWIGVCSDITERVMAEEQLRHAQKMEAVGMLAGGLAHDFNNILAGIMGYASLTKQTLEKDSPSIADMESIERLSRRGADLTQALLTFSRKGEYHPRPLLINPIIEEILNIVGRTVGKGINMRADLSPGVSNVMGDEGQLNQVIMNLCLNACEAMMESDTLAISTKDVELDDGFFKIHPGLKEGAYVAMIVSDTGRGMDAGTLERIFEPFFTTRAEMTGTGLGLSIVSGIVESHGGCIEVESQPGRGSTFTVYLPVTSEEVKEIRPKPPGTLRGNETILVVDDEEDFRRSTGKWLKKLGYTAVEAASGERALKVVEERKEEIDLVLLDMVMNGIGGSETFEGIKKIVSALPVIICTGYSLDGDSRQVLEKGANDFIQKPFDLTKLALKVRKVLDNR